MFVNYAHRGASAYAPENTMVSFRMGLEMGANGIETDVQETKDGVLVLFHDKTIERCSNGVGRVSDYTYSELLELDFGSWKGEKYRGEPIAAFEDFAREFFPMDITFAIELKSPGIERKVYDIIKRYAVHDKIYVSSFDFENLRAMSLVSDEIKLCWLMVGEITQEHLDKVKSIGGVQIAPKCAFVTPEGVALAKANGIGVRLWGTSDEEIMRKVYTLDTEGMTVNFPDKLHAYIG